MLVFSALLALATGVLSNPYQSNMGRVVVRVRHPGPPVPVKMAIRTKETMEAEWEYFRDVNMYPRKAKTSPIGRRVTVSLPSNLQKFVQVCSLYEPIPKLEEDNTPRAVFSLESCANVPLKR